MIYVTSDLHGFTAEQLQALLAKAGFGPEDELYVLGDVIDRSGLGGVDTLQWLMRQDNVELLQGNHEAMLLGCSFLFDEITEQFCDEIESGDQLKLLMTWIRNGAEPTINALRQLMAEDPLAVFDLLDYLRDAPLYAMVEAGGRDYLLLHGGLPDFSPAKKLRDYAPHDVLWHRPDWEEAYFDDVTVVLGHTPTAYYGGEHAGRMLVRPTWIDIDTSNVAPMLLRLDDLQAFYMNE